MGDNDSETFVNVTLAKWDFDDDVFDEITGDAKDIIEQLLQKDPRSDSLQSAILSTHHLCWCWGTIAF